MCADLSRLAVEGGSNGCNLASAGDLGRQPAGPGASARAAPSLSFHDVYEAHLPFVWRTLARMGVPPTYLEDAAQDVFVVVHRQLSHFEGRSTPKTWLFSIAFRVSKEWLRRSRRTRTEELPQELVDEQTRGPHEEAVRTESVALLYELLSTLNPDKRAAFILGELEQLSAPEIADALGANVNTIASRLRAARREFEASLRRHQARERRRSR